MKFLKTFKSRFILIFSILAIILCVILSILSAWQTLKVASDLFAAEGLVLVNKAVALINGDSFEILAKSLDKNDPFYLETQQKLLNLKETSDCRYLYTMAPVQGNIWRFIIDGSGPLGSENFSDLGVEEDTSMYNKAFNIVWDTKTPGHGSIEYSNLWGWVVSIYTPIWNSAGEAVGIAGCDFSAEALFVIIKNSTIRQIVVVLVLMIIGMVLTILFLQSIFKQFIGINSSLGTVLDEITAGEEDLVRWINVRGKSDEIKELSHFFKATMDKIRNQIKTGQELSISIVGESKKAGKDKKNL